jgi:hypothetical protein
LYFSYIIDKVIKSWGMRLTVHVACTEDANSACIILFGRSQKEFPELREDKPLFTTVEHSSLIPNVCSFPALISLSDILYALAASTSGALLESIVRFSRPHALQTDVVMLIKPFHFQDMRLKSVCDGSFQMSPSFYFV